jgi:hypothetical protein
MHSTSIVFARPSKERIAAILKRHGMDPRDLKCSVCGRDLSDLKHLRAIFPYKSALICCDKFECISACRDKLIAEGLP